MYPAYKNKDLIVAIKSNFFIKKNSFVVFTHKNYTTLMVKQICKTRTFKQQQNGKDTKQTRYYLLGIDKINSIDSRELGWINKKDISHHIMFKIPKSLIKYL